MASFLERYQAGECEAVWRELVALGARVQDEPLRSQAYAVAAETMRRARHNIDLLTARLREKSFDFRYPKQAFLPPSGETLAAMQAFEREVGPVPLSLQAWAREVGEVNLMGNHPQLCYYARMSNPLMAFGGFGGGQTLDLNSLLQSLGGGKRADMPGNLNNLVSTMQNAFQNLMGGKGAASPEAASDTPEMAADEQLVSDPLVVDLSELSIDAYEEWQDYGEDAGDFRITIAPDIYHKANISGSDGYEILLPQGGADAALLNTEWGDLTFVEYLRLSFNWAGFPGLQSYDGRDEALLASLKAGFLPL